MAEWLKAVDCKSILVRVRGFESLPANKIGALAQLARASVWQIEGRRFKSCRLHNKIASGDARVRLKWLVLETSEGAQVVSSRGSNPLLQTKIV